MAEKRRTLVASLALTAGLAGGAAAGFILGVPGVSGAQTATTVAVAPSTAVPGATGQAPAHDGKDCPNMGDGGAPSAGGGASGTSAGDAATNAGFGHRGRGGPPL